MADTNFVDQQTTVVAAWLNDINVTVYRLLGNSSGAGGTGGAPASVADIISNLGLSSKYAPISGSSQYAPSSGSTIYASSANLAASGGAGLVGYSQGASGSVLRTVAAKLQESVSVLDFGADPTGTTDSTAAIQATIDAVALVGGGIVYFPPGVYLHSAQINIKNSAVRLVGAGAGGYQYSAPYTTAAVILRATAAMTNQVLFSPQYPLNVQFIMGGEFSQIYLDGNSVAEYGLGIKSCVRGKYEAIGTGQTVSLFYGGVDLPGEPLSSDAGSQQNHIVVQGNMTGTAGLVYVDGQNLEFTGYASGTTLTVTSIAAGNYVIPAMLRIGGGDTATAAGPAILAYGSGGTTGTGGTGTYELSSSLTQYSSGAPGLFSITNADFSSNNVDIVDGIVASGNGVVVKDADNNRFGAIRIFVSGASVSYGVYLSAGGWGASARQNYFNTVAISGTPLDTVYSEGTGTKSFAAINNFIDNFDASELVNGQPKVDATSSLFWRTSQIGLAGYFPAVSVGQVANGPFSSTTPVTINFSAVNFDLASNFTSSNKFTAPKPGIYKVDLRMLTAGGVVAGDTWKFTLYSLGAYSVNKSLYYVAPETSPYESIQMSGLFQLAPGDTIQAEITRIAGTGTWTPGTGDSSLDELSIHYVSMSA